MTINKTPAYLSVLMAALLAAGAHAQSTSASGSSDLPPKAGEASTQTMGAPNAQTTNSTASETPAMSKDQVRQDAQGRNTASGTSSVPMKAGEASTTVQGKPNASKQVAGKTREEVRAELLSSRKNYQDNLRAKRNPEQRLGVMGASGSGTTSATVGATGSTGGTGGASGDAAMGAGATGGAASTGGGGAGTSSGTK
ncbi:MAG: hypothetical protein V4787_13610 [Pseudomonadota bacterium]